MVKLAKSSRHHSQQHAAFLFKGGAVRSVGTNYGGQHAEVRCMNSALWQPPEDLKHFVLLSVRVGKNGQLKNANPCNKCREAIRARGIRIILYSTEHGDIRKEKWPIK